jgi:hypothetical protein
LAERVEKLSAYVFLAEGSVAMRPAGRLSALSRQIYGVGVRLAAGGTEKLLDEGATVGRAGENGNVGSNCQDAGLTEWQTFGT